MRYELLQKTVNTCHRHNVGPVSLRQSATGGHGLRHPMLFIILLHVSISLSLVSLSFILFSSVALGCSIAHAKPQQLEVPVEELIKDTYVSPED